MTPVEKDYLLAGGDSVAIDAVAAQDDGLRSPDPALYPAGR